MPVHPYILYVLYVFRKDVGRHSDDRDPRQFRIRQRADRFRSFIAVHYRHLDIHQHAVIITGAGHRHFFLPNLSVFRRLYLEAQFHQDHLRNFPVDRIIFYQQQSFITEVRLKRGRFVVLNRFRFRFVLRQREPETNDELRTFSLLRNDINRTAHQIHEALCDSHPQTRALDVCHRFRPFPFVRLKHPGGKFRAHADTGILHAEGIETGFPVGAGLMQRHRNIPALGRKLEGVADQVQQDPVQAAHVAHYRPIGNIHCGYRVMQSLGLHLS